MGETVSSPRADRSQSLLLSGNKLKLAVFGANVSGGCRQVKTARLVASLASIEVFSSGVILRSV